MWMPQCLDIKIIISTNTELQIQYYSRSGLTFFVLISNTKTHVPATLRAQWFHLPVYPSGRYSLPCAGHGRRREVSRSLQVSQHLKITSHNSPSSGLGESFTVPEIDNWGMKTTLWYKRSLIWQCNRIHHFGNRDRTDFHSYIISEIQIQTLPFSILPSNAASSSVRVTRAEVCF